VGACVVSAPSLFTNAWTLGSSGSDSARPFWLSSESDSTLVFPLFFSFAFAFDFALDLAFAFGLFFFFFFPDSASSSSLDLMSAGRPSNDMTFSEPGDLDSGDLGFD
jgi:hypothetical protein